MADKLLYKVEEAAERIGIGRSTFYALIRSGQVETVKVGKSRLVPALALDEFVARVRTAQSPAASPEGVQA